LEAHLAFAHKVTPAVYVHALDVDALLDPAVTFFSARRDRVVRGFGPLKRLICSRSRRMSTTTG
jgi:putative acetyltransferase